VTKASYRLSDDEALEAAKLEVSAAKAKAENRQLREEIARLKGEA
jgi:hypothetical protein